MFLYLGAFSSSQMFRLSHVILLISFNFFCFRFAFFMKLAQLLVVYKISNCYPLNLKEGGWLYFEPFQ